MGRLRSAFSAPRLPMLRPIANGMASPPASRPRTTETATITPRWEAIRAKPSRSGFPDMPNRIRVGPSEGAALWSVAGQEGADRAQSVQVVYVGRQGRYGDGAHAAMAGREPFSQSGLPLDDAAAIGVESQQPGGEGT